MAGSNPGRRQSKKSAKQKDRLERGVAQSSSRVSKVVGGARVRVEQRANYPSHKQGARNSPSPAAKRGRARAGAKKASPPPGATVDSRVISKARDAWGNLGPHHQQRILGIFLLGLALFLFAVLTVFRKVQLFSAISGAFTALFGWSTYVLALGLIAFATAHLIEGIRKQRFIRWSLVIGLALLWLIVLVESQLLLGGTTGGVLGELLVRPLLGWPRLAGHLLLIGLFGIVTIIAFQITLGHILSLAHGLGRLVPPGSKSMRAHTGPSPLRGQRPRFSRYAGNPRQAASAGAAGEEEDDLIEFESDFETEHEDPLNDIKLHKQQVGRVPRVSPGSGAAQPLNLAEHNQAVAGASQQPLPFDQQAKRPAMEPLAPNPLRRQQPRSLPRPLAEAPALASPWKIPDTSLLNNPEEVKKMLSDDTSTLAKTIQDTLRSFRVDAEVKPEDISIGPTVIRFGIRPTGKAEMKQDEKGKYTPVRDASGNIVYEARTRVSRIMALQNDLALVLEAKTIRMEAPVPGRPYVGVEIPNKNSRLVTLREVLESKEYQGARAKSKLAVALGKDVAGAVRVGDLARMPHLLIAGATGAGKCLAYNESVFLSDGRVVKVQELIGQSVQVVGVTDTQTMQQTPVQATFTENGVQDVFEIELDNGVILRRTGEHPLWAATLDENQHTGRTRAINSGWVHSKDLRVCGNRPHVDGHVILCPLEVHQQGTDARSDADVILCAALLAEGGLNTTGRSTGAPRFTNADPIMVEQVAVAAKEYSCQSVLSPYKVKGNSDYYISQVSRKGISAAKKWKAWHTAQPRSDQKFADCPQGYEWRKIVSIRRITAPTVNIQVHSENHAFVGYAVEHNSVMINTIIASILTQATPDDARMLMVDPKMVELNMYSGIPHLLSPVVTEVERVVPLLKNAIAEMERRYRLFSQLGVRNLDGYRKMRLEKAAHGDSSLKNLPAIVIVIDELADLMMAAPEEVEGMICRLAQLARATGIHLVIATQRPSVDVITGLIKANIPTRISFMVSSAVDSRTIIDMGGAERLLGRGDMLYLPAEAGRPERIQGAFLADDEAEMLVAYWREQLLQHMPVPAGNGGNVQEVLPAPAVEPGWEIQEQNSDDFELEDDLLEKAEEVVREYERASISLLQRRLRIGYSRAARLIDLLEERGIIGSSEPGGRSREVLDGGYSRSAGDRRMGGGGSGGEGRTMADEVADIIAEEKAREEFMKKQGLRGQAPGQVNEPAHMDERDED